MYADFVGKGCMYIWLWIWKNDFVAEHKVEED